MNTMNKTRAVKLRVDGDADLTAMYAMRGGVAGHDDVATPAAPTVRPEVRNALESIVDARVDTFIRDNIGEVFRSNPQAIVSALAEDPDGMRTALRALGWSETESNVSTSHLANAYREAISFGTIDSGFGTHARSRCIRATYEDPQTGRKRGTFIHNEQVIEDSLAWLRAVVLNTESRGIDPQTGQTATAIRARLDAWVRAPNANASHFGANGTTGEMAATVPTIIQAEIWEIINEDYQLPMLAQKFTSAAPLQMPRLDDDAVVYTGGNMTDLTGTKITTDSVKLSPNRVGAITFVDPQLAIASNLGVVRYIIGKLARAYAKFLQQSIISGDGNGKPKGWLAQATADADDRLNLRVQAYTNTDNATRRLSTLTALYRVPVGHRGTGGSSRFRWICNGMGIVALRQHNDTNEKPWADGKYWEKDVVETEQIATAAGTPNTTTLLGVDMGAYAFVESPSGMELAQTTEGAGAFESHAIAVKLVAHVDGDVILPNAGVRVNGVVVAG